MDDGDDERPIDEIDALKQAQKAASRGLRLGPLKVSSNRAFSQAQQAVNTTIPIFADLISFASGVPSGTA